MPSPDFPEKTTSTDGEPVLTARGLHGKNFRALIFGALAAVLFFGIVIAMFWSETREVKGSLPEIADATKPKNPLTDTTQWQLGPEPAKDLDGDGDSDIGWWTRTFDLPRPDAVIAYFKDQGLAVAKIIPLHFENTKDEEAITYQVYADVPQQLMRLQKIDWDPKEPDLAPFARVLILNDGLPPGTLWDAKDSTVAADAGTKLNFSWQVKWDKDFNTVTTDRLPFEDGVFSQQQIAQFQSATDRAIAQLQGRIDQIDKQVDADIQEKIAQLPTNLRQRDLNRQRTRIKQDGLTEKQQKLQVLAEAISSANGHLSGSNRATPVQAPSHPVANAKPSSTGPVPLAVGVNSPIKVAVIDASSHPSKNGLGNIQVTYFNGKKEVLTKTPNSSQPRLSGKGDIGWIYGVGDDPKNGRDMDILTVHLADGTIKTFQANALYIEDWAFADNDTAVVIRSTNQHGYDSYIKRDLHTGKTIDHVDQTTSHIPPWGQPIAGPPDK